MKVIFYLSSLSAGGAERVTATLANHWARKAWSVAVVTVTGKQRDFYSLDAEVRRIALDLDANSANQFQAIGNNWRRVRNLGAVLRQEQPDVAVGMMASASATLALASWRLPITTVGSERIHPPMLPLGRSWEAVRRWSYRRLSAVVAQTRESADWLRANAPAPTIEVIPNPLCFPLALQDPRLEPEAILRELACSHVLLAVGRLDWQKGFDRLLAAFAVVNRSYPEWTLIVLGQGNQRASLQEQAKSLGIDQCVQFPGAVGNVGEWFEVADAYALTSRFEGFPNTLLEALAHGVPSVAVDCETGPREILSHEEDGLLVPQDDHNALVDALERLMAGPALRARFAERAVEVRERFAVERIAEQWEQLFDRV